MEAFFMATIRVLLNNQGICKISFLGTVRRFY